MKYIFILLLLVGFKIARGSDPPKNWKSLNSSSYYFHIFETGKTFWAANDFCHRSYNSCLITVNSEDIWLQVSKELLSRNISEVWIGLTDYSSENKFRWIANDSKVFYDNFEKDYPKDFRNASDCVIAKLNSEDKYTWRDVHCTQSHYYICMWMNKTETPTVKNLPDQSHYTNQCPKPFFPVDGDCFWVSHENLSWNQSRVECQKQQLESDLASIRTEFQKEYFASLISGNSTGFWTGLNFYEGTSQWILQQELSNINIADIESDEQESKESCMFMSGNEHNLGKLVRASCSTNLKAICQTLKKNNSSQSKDSTPYDTDINYDGILYQKGDCMQGYLYYHGSCYRLLTEKPVDHDEATDLCEKETVVSKTNFTISVNVVNFETFGEKYFILSNFRRSGLGSSNNGLWLGVIGSKTENETLSIVISNDSLIPNFEYNSNQLKDEKNICFKLLMNGTVSTSSCWDSSTALTMCEYQLKNFHIGILSSNNQTAVCPKDWELFNSVCFYFENEIVQSAYLAKQKCLKLRSHIPSIDMSQQSFLKNFIKTKRFKNLKSKKAWIGLEITNKDSNIQYKWSNEESVRYINIKKSQFVFEQKNKKWCTLFSFKNGLWEVVSCTDVKASLLCQKSANITTIVNKNIPTAAKIITTPKPSLQTGFQIHETDLTWNDAFNQCFSPSLEDNYFSNLASFKQYSEISELKSLIRQNKSLVKSKFWIGISGFYDHFDNVFLRWSDNSSLKFQNFDYDNLMNLTGTENCVLIDINSGKWLVASCDNKYPYICKIAKKSVSNEQDESNSKFLESANVDIPTSCPENYADYAKKCYHVVDDTKLNWKDADHYCQNLPPESFRSTATLATIESTYENSFVYSLLSSNLFSNDSRYWIGFRDFKKDDLKKICVALSGHPDPYIGARWFTSDCSSQFKFVCSITKRQESRKFSPNKKCREDYIGYTNAMDTSCYSYKPHEILLDEARIRCAHEGSIQSHLVTIKSHYHMHFLRCFMMYEGLSRDRLIWLGAEIESYQKYYNWRWDNKEDIRYTVWNKAPVFDDDTFGNLCLYFLSEKNSKNNFGMQIDRCFKLRSKGYAICEYTADNNDQRKANCLKDVNGESYNGDTNVTLISHRCIRWDLLNNSLVTTKIIRSIRNDRRKRRFIQYHSNECRYIKGMDKQTTFCVVMNTKESEEYVLEECNIPLCRNISKTLHHEIDLMDIHSRSLTIVLVTMVLLLCIIICIAMLSWRRWNKGALFGGYLRRSQFPFLNNQSRGTSFNNPIYRPINT